MTFELELKELIKEKYGSINAFSKVVDLPYSTIDNIFKRGIMGVGVQNVLKICSELNIDIDKIRDDELVFKEQTKTDSAQISEQDKEFYSDYLNLSEQGKEYMRQTMDMVKDKYKKDSGVSDMETKIG